VIEHYKFCRGSTEIFDSMRTILGLDIWCIAYLTQIFIFFPVQSNPRQLIGAPSRYLFSSHIWFGLRQELEMFKQCIGNICMIFNILSMKSSDSNTNMMHQAGWWSLGKIMLGRLIPSSSKVNASSSSLEWVRANDCPTKKIPIYVLLSNIWHLIDPYK